MFGSLTGLALARCASIPACPTAIPLIKPHKVIVGGASCQIIAYAIQAGAPPFPAFCLSFFINGIGMGIQDAQANTLVANLDLVDGRTTRMSCLHAFYGWSANEVRNARC